MASPQAENKKLTERDYQFVTIPCAFIESFKEKNVSGRERILVDHLARKTFGWDKYFDRISLSQWVRDTGLPLSTVRHRLEALLKKKVITKRRGRINEWGWHESMWNGNPPESYQLAVKGHVQKEAVSEKGHVKSGQGGAQIRTSGGAQGGTVQQTSITTDTPTTDLYEDRKEKESPLVSLLDHWNNTKPKGRSKQGVAHVLVYSVNARLEIKNRFEEGYTLEDLKASVTNFQSSLDVQGDDTEWLKRPFTMDVFFRDVFQGYLPKNFNINNYKKNPLDPDLDEPDEIIKVI